MSDRELRYTPDARRDIRMASRDSLDRWGTHQRDAYTERLNTAIEHLLHFPEAGRARDDITPGLRMYPVGEHIVYYRVSDLAVTIARVLHHRIDVTTQFER